MSPCSRQSGDRAHSSLVCTTPISRTISMSVRVNCDRSVASSTISTRYPSKTSRAISLERTIGWPRVRCAT